MVSLFRANHVLLRKNVENRFPHFCFVLFCFAFNGFPHRVPWGPFIIVVNTGFGLPFSTIVAYSIAVFVCKSRC